MLSLYILSAYPEVHGNYVARALRTSGAAHQSGDYILSNNAESADIILFAEAHPVDDPLFFQVALHPLRRRHGQKCFLYTDTDYAFPLLRGLYPSLLTKDHNPVAFRGAAYYGQVDQNHFIHPQIGGSERYLAVFSGAMTHPLRNALLDSLSSDTRFLLRDTSGKHSWKLQEAEKSEYQRQYANELHLAPFILCPRGIGPNSYRLFETMKAGKCPVIISDDWTPPAGPDWENCSIRISEEKLSEIPTLLTRAHPRAVDLGAAARLAWERYFSPENSFHSVATQCAQLLQAGASANYHGRVMFTRPCRGHLRRALRYQGFSLPLQFTKYLLAID